MDPFVQLVKALSWPIVTISIAYLFRSELRGLIARVSRFRYKELEFEAGLATAEKSATVVLERIKSLPKPDPESGERLRELRDLAEVSPRAAILEAWIMIEEAASRSGFITGADVPRTNVMNFVDYLVHAGRLPAESASLVGGLRMLRNQAAHYFDFTLPAFDLKKEDADRYLALASKVSSLILNPSE